MLFWRRLGWLVPVILAAVFVGGQLGLNAVKGWGFYESTPLVKPILATLAALLIGISGYVLNSRSAAGYLHESTGKRIDAPSHTFFFVRMELWALIIPVLFIFPHFNELRTYNAQTSYMEDPAVGDIYIVNFREIGLPYGKGFEHGVLKIDAVEDETVTFLVNELLYPKSDSIKYEVENGQVDEPVYYSDQKLELPRSSLTGLREDGIIHSVIRDQA